jgi:hypothetical protein
VKHSETLGEIAPALVSALAEIGGAKKGKVNPQFKSRYADLESVILASKDILAENGLALVQFPTDCVGGVLHLETVFIHKSGEWIGAEMGIALGKIDPQGVGSALTYARRYAQMAALNMPAVDDDGEAAMGRRGISPEPAGPDFPGAEGVKGRSSYAVKKEDGGARFNEIKAEIEGLTSMTEVGLFIKERTAEITTVPESWRKVLRETLQEQERVIKAQAPAEEDF